MSTTIGLGYSTSNGREIFSEILLIAEKFGYGILNGIEFAERDVRSGLQIMQKNENWLQLLFLQSPKNGDVSLAFGIHEELTTFEITNEPPRFFEFLNEVSQFATLRCKKFGFFFAGEWHAKDRVRYSYGDIDRLIALLSMPGNWEIRYMIPENGRLQDSDETPFVFDLQIKK